MIATLALLGLLTFTGQGISQERPYALMVGDPAPAVQVSRFFKGQPIKDFQKGQVYVNRVLGNLVRPVQGVRPAPDRAEEETRRQSAYPGNQYLGIAPGGRRSG
jgi:hypothetical protein